ncbi:MAG: sulfite exporter TauE/SafE family protein [Desulfobacteraceae bacterium]|nr:sulfite exporter TauE/SafE family protein [Desulfobacteraceae bacterium]
MTEPQALVALISVCALTYSFEIIFGLAGTIMMLPILGFFFDSKTLVIYSLLPQLLVAGIALTRSHQKLDLRLLWPMLALAALGGLAGSYFFIQIPQEIFRRLLAATIIAAGIFLIIGPRFRLGPVTQRVLDFLAGVSHALFGISGPIVMTRLLGSLEDKTMIRNSALFFFSGLNCVRAVYYLLHGSITAQIQHMFVVSAIFLIPILMTAERLHFKLNDLLFKKVVAWIILFCGVVYMLR